MAGLWLAGIAGLATSIGPCSASRSMALVGVLSQSSAAPRWYRVLLFFCGSAWAFAGIACAGGTVLRFLASSRFMYGALAVAFVIAGVSMLLVHTGCKREHGGRTGSAFLAGASGGMAFSPCCAPALLVLGGLGTGVTTAAACLGAATFLLGHLAPTLVLATYASRLADRFEKSGLTSAVRTVGGATMIALGLYYGSAL